MFILYLLVSFIVFFICNKKLYPIIVEKQEKDGWLKKVEIKEFWLMIIIPIFWIVALPVLGLWELLETIYNKFN